MNLTQDQLSRLVAGGGDVYTRQHDKVGRLGQIYLDNETSEPKWVTVKTGMFGTGESFAPLIDADVDGDDLVINYSADQVKDAPRVDPDGALSLEEEDRLYAYYGVDVISNSAETSGAPEGQFTESGTTGGTVGHDVSGPTTDDAMTRSEEQLHVGTRTEESGRVRLRKYVVTENVTQTVPVSHEEVRVEREPITDANRGQAMEGPGISEEEHEVVLNAERPVVEKEAVPVERVRLDTETVTEQETVSDDVRKEEIELDDTAGDVGRPNEGRGAR
jgi:uncharacterized protein (TIGR02271 family)